jgi:pyruvate formate lyase activating enzyme
MIDRGPTPAATLASAHEIARDAGIRYVYTGNVVDPERQHTYCPSCKRSVMQRDGYTIRSFDLQQGRCRHCQTPVAGRYDDAPGAWGNRRMPVRIVECSE